MHPKRPQDDFSAEIEAHIRLEADRFRERGMTEEQAIAAARRSFGNVTASRERFYESRRWLWCDWLKQDVRLGLRLLAKTPGWTAVAVATVALGIGAVTAIFSVVDTVLLRPLPFAHPGQLYNVTEGTTRLGDLAMAPDYFILREIVHSDSNSAIAEMGAYGTDDRVLFYGARGSAALRPNVSSGGRPAGRGKGGTAELRVMEA
jgi:hypothetical protein